MSTEREVVTSRFDAHRKYEVRESGKNSLNSEVLNPTSPTHVVLPPQFHQKIELWNNINDKQEAIGTLITAYTGYILNPTESIGFDLACRPEEVPKWKQNLYADYTKTCNAVIADIYAGVNLKSVQSVQLQSDGRLVLFTPQWNKELNILDLWNRSIPGASEKDNQKWPLYLPESEHLSEIRRMQARVRQETRVAQEQVQENLESESFMGWIVQFFYESTPAQVVHTATPGVVLWGLATSVAWNTGKSIVKLLKKITFRGQDGKIYLIDPVRYPIQGTKDWMKKNFLQVLERFDLQYDPRWRNFYNPEGYTFSKVKDMMGKLTYEEYKKIAWKNAVSEKEWKQAKEKMNAWNISEVYASLTKEKTFSDQLRHFLKENTLELVFYPLAFEHFRRNQTDVNLIRGISGWTAAIAGVKMGKKAPGWGVVKFVVWALAWAGMMMYSDKKLTASVNKWRYFFGKDAWEYSWHERSRTWQVLSSLWLNEAWDLINKYSLPGGKEEPVDINILPRIDMAGLPKVPIIQSSISIGMNPWEWIRDSAVRDIDDWNNKVPKYTEKLARDTLELARAFIQKDPPFSRGDGEEKFKEKFNRLIFSWGSLYFSEAREQILGVVLAELWNWSGWRSEWIILDIIRSRASDFYINTENLNKRKEKLVEKKQKITEKTKLLVDAIKSPITTQDFTKQYAPEKLKNPISPETQKVFVNELFDKMLQGKEIVTPSRWEKTELLWTTSKKLVLSDDIIIFQSLLRNEITVPWCNTSVCSTFATLLDEMVEYTEESHFIQQVLSGNKKWYTSK